jgi:prepilin-type N-terminal cleavage/methylation domain-containing protein
MRLRRQSHFAFSLLELMAAVAILAILAVSIIPRGGAKIATAKKNTCYVNKGEIELQVKLWRRNNAGSYPAANLSDIGVNTSYFPQGLPVCPVDGTAYTINTTTGLVTGHTH